MAEHGVECLDCVSVDNALVRAADPLFAGFCHEQNAQCGELSQSGLAAVHMLARPAHPARLRVTLESTSHRNPSRGPCLSAARGQLMGLCRRESVE